MTETTEEKRVARKWERTSEKKFPSYELAKHAQELLGKTPRSRVRRRSDGSFDLITYKKIDGDKP